MVYLAKKDGGVVHHTSLQALKEMDGIEKPDMQVSDEEFEAAGSLVRIIDGKIVLGKTKAEKTAEVNQKRIVEIDTELDDIDRKSGRPARAVSFAVAKGKTPPADDVSKLDEYEKRAAALREERATLLTPGVAG